MVSDEARSRTRTEFYFWGDRIVLTRGASALALLFHQAVKLHYVDLDSVAAQDVLRQIERKAVRVVELESDFAGKRMAIRLPEPRALGLDEFESTIERFTEALFFLGYNVGDAARFAAQFGIGVAHRFRYAIAHLREKRTPDAEVATVAGGAANDPAPKVLAGGSPGGASLGNEECERTCVGCRVA